MQVTGLARSEAQKEDRPAFAGPSGYPSTSWRGPRLCPFAILGDIVRNLAVILDGIQPDPGERVCLRAPQAMCQRADQGIMRCSGKSCVAFCKMEAQCNANCSTSRIQN